jgi:hypothetical protein
MAVPPVAATLRRTAAGGRDYTGAAQAGASLPGDLRHPAGVESTWGGSVLRNALRDLEEEEERSERPDTAPEEAGAGACPAPAEAPASS